MSKPFYRLTRDLHLYFGLFLSPFVLVFAVSAILLVHSWPPGGSGKGSVDPTVTDLTLPADLEVLSGRPRLDKLRPVLDLLGVAGEVGWVRHVPKEHRLIIPVSVPGRVTTVTLDVTSREASVEWR